MLGSDSVSGVPKSSDSFKCRCRIFLFISEIESSFFNAFLERMRMLHFSFEKFSRNEYSTYFSIPHRFDPCGR